MPKVPTKIDIFYEWLKKNSDGKINPNVFRSAAKTAGFGEDVNEEATYISFVNEFYPQHASKEYLSNLYDRLKSGEAIYVVALPDDYIDLGSGLSGTFNKVDKYQLVTLDFYDSNTRTILGPNAVTTSATAKFIGDRLYTL